MNQSRPRFFTYLILIFFVAVVIACGMSVNYINQFPTKAEMLYGPPSIHLSAIQRYRLSYNLVNNQPSIKEPVSTIDQPVLFSISLDESTTTILQRLQTTGLIHDSAITRDYLVYTGLDTQLQAGDFYLSPSMNTIEIVDQLLDSTPLFVTVSILPGWRLEEIAASLPSAGLSITPDEFIAAANQRYNQLSITQEIPFNSSLEGLFPPGNFEVERTITAQQLVTFLLEKFEERITTELTDGFTRQGLTLYQAITLASIVEKEAVLEEEMPLIASVFLNRLAISMKLETDPTVQYAVGNNNQQQSWWVSPLNYSHLETDAPYNTYLYPGLPPTPIAASSDLALQAVAFPAQTPYYYFRAACDKSGRHNFSETYEEHLSYACQ